MLEPLTVRWQPPGEGTGPEQASSADVCQPPAPQCAKTVVLRNVVVQQAASEETGLPHRATVQSLILENLSPDSRELASAFGLAQAEVGGQGGAAAAGPDVETMDVEQLRAEVQMWRLRSGR